MSKNTFEQNIKELENVVRSLEAGDITLEEMLALFEKGIKFTKECTQMLDNAEQKIKILVKNSEGSVEEQDFES